MPHPTGKLAQSIPVHPGAEFRVTDGANLGDSLSIGDDLVLNDIYQLSPNTGPARLSVYFEDMGDFTIAANTAIGAAGAILRLDCCATFMCDDGTTTEVLVLAENGGSALYALPLAPLNPKTNYTLVGIDTQVALAKFAELACPSFTRGTHITLASGAQVPIESLKNGDQVLTRDAGPQKIRWIGQNTVRAVGDFAPVVITAGTLNNEDDLIVSPEHRLFIYQRSDVLGARRSGLLIKARHLINGTTVLRRNGGFVDYFQILFDEHQIIYAEGIAVETLRLDTRTGAALPQDMLDTLARANVGEQMRRDLDFEVPEKLLDRIDAAETLRRASIG